MKPFFRLLLISFGLLLFLGLNETPTEGGESGSFDVPTSSLQYEQTQLFSGKAGETSQILYAFKLRILQEYKQDKLIPNEFSVSSGIQTQFLLTMERYLEFCPGLQGKTGFKIHLPAHRGDPSLA